MTPARSEPRVDRKLQASIAPLLGDGEVLVAAAQARQGPELEEFGMTFWFAPWVSAITAGAVYRTGLLVQTNKQTRFYRTSTLRPSCPTRFVSLVHCPPSETLTEHGVVSNGETWRVRDGWTQPCKQFRRQSLAESKSAAVVLPESHDQALRRNRRASRVLGAALVLVPALLIAGLILVLRAVL